MELQPVCTLTCIIIPAVLNDTAFKSSIILWLEIYMTRSNVSCVMHCSKRVVGFNCIGTLINYISVANFAVVLAYRPPASFVGGAEIVDGENMSCVVPCILVLATEVESSTSSETSPMNSD